MKKLWIGYRVYPDGHKKSLTPGGKRVFGDAKKRWLTRRAKLLRQTAEFKRFVPAPPAPVHPLIPHDNFSAHFTKAEFACHDGTPVPQSLYENATRLANAAEKVRAQLGVPVTFLSVYRTPAYNAKIHGARNSRHTFADAGDIDMAAMAKLGRTHADVLEAVEAVPEIHGVGIYPSGAIHMDTRPGSRVFWNDWVRQ